MRVPGYRHHKARDLAVVRLDGRDVYLGTYDSPESHAKYRQVIAEWLARKPAAQSSAPEGHTVDEIVMLFLEAHKDYYTREDGTPTGELNNFVDALRPVRQIYGREMATEFGPLKLKSIRQDMVRAGLARTTVNTRVRRIIQVFRWAVSEELVPPSVHQGLKSVRGLQRGRSGARETAPVRPAPEAAIDAVFPYVPRQVWAMVQVQRLTGMRPDEVCQMRTRDIDRTGRVWLYTPHTHKTKHRGKPRVIPIGPKAQAILGPWLDRIGYLFSPAEARAEWVAAIRKPKPAPKRRGWAKPKPKRKPKRAPRDRYDSATYAQAIARACERAGVEHWSPGQLRHNAGTVLRREFGLDVARAVLGHASAHTTEVYAERDATIANEAIERIG
jgi:integrase